MILYQTIKVSNLRKGYAVITNEDLVSGEGLDYPKFVSSSFTAATKLAKRAYIKGADAAIVEYEIFMYGGQQYGPVKVEEPTYQQSVQDQIREDTLEFNRKRQNLIVRLIKENNLSVDEVKLLNNNCSIEEE